MCQVTESATLTAMSRRTSSAQPAEQRALDLLAGRIPIAADALLEVIHAINPTARSLAPAHERRRYQLKARLQSLLIRTFIDDLVISEEGHRVIAIRHRYLGRDACHAQLDELDDDARARVQWLLDTGAAPDAAPDDPRLAPAAAATAASSGRVIEQGRTALEAFDYDTARACFERAVAASPDDPVAAGALLELLVDHLALDADALALEDQLAAHAADDAEVRGFLAVAAARLGEGATARRLLGGLSSTRAADAWASLAYRAVEQRAIDELESSLARLVQIDPARPELVELRSAYDRLRADASRPAEEELVRAAEQLDDAALESMARALLVRWPDSAIAGKVVSGIRDRRRAGEAELAMARARAALSTGELGRALELCRQARALGAESQAVIDEIRQAEAVQRRLRDDADAAAVCALLGEPDRRAGLARYLTLEAELRRRVRSQLALAMLDWLESATRHHKESRHGALIDAVLALAAAGDALARGDDEHAIALLERHAPALGDVGHASELAAEAHRRIAVRRRATATTGIEQARDALAAGDLDGCERACDQLDRRDLDGTQRQQLDELVDRLRARRDTSRRRAQIAQLVAAGDLVAARRELEVLLTARSLPSDDAASLRAEHDALRAELRRVWSVQADELGELQDGRDRVGELVGPLPYSSSVLAWLVAGARELLLATAEGAHVFLARVLVDDGRLLDRRYLRAPAPLGTLVAKIVDGDTLWLIDQDGRALQVAWRTGEPLRWASLASFLIGDERIEHVFVVPGGSHLWLEAMAPRGEPVTRVIEIDTWRLRRELPRSRSLQPLVAGPASCVIGTAHEGGALRYTERGSVLEDLPACAGVQVSAVASAPEGGLVVLGHRFDEIDELEIARVEDGRIVHRSVLPESCYERAHRAATAGSAGLVIVHHVIEIGDARLVTLRIGDPDLAPVYTVVAPSDLALFQDVDATEVVGMWDTDRGVELARISAEPPAFGDAPGLRARWSLPALASYFPCGPYKAHEDDGGRLYAANQAACRGEWQDVRAKLETVALDSVGPDELPHHCHLLGLALLRTGGDPAQIRALWTTGQAHERSDDLPFRSCQLDANLELLDAPSGSPAGSPSASASLTRQLRAVLATADRLLAGGDPQAALNALRCRAVTSVSELQSAARLAAAWLAIEVDRARDRFDKAIALARFVQLHARDAIQLPIEAAYPPDRMADLVAQAQRWLATWQASEAG